MSHMGVDASRAAERKDLFDMLNTMREAAWQSFDKRREHEWRICVSLWALLAGATVLIVTEDVRLCCVQQVLGVVLIVALLWVYIVFMQYLASAMRIDRVKERHYEEQIKGLLKVEFAPEYSRRIDFYYDYYDRILGFLFRLRYWRFGKRRPQLDTVLRRCKLYLKAFRRVHRQGMHGLDHFAQERTLDDCPTCPDRDRCKQRYPLQELPHFWSHAAQVWITVLLAAIAIAAILGAIPGTQGS